MNPLSKNPIETETLKLFKHFFEEKIPFNKVMGIKILEVSDGKGKLSFDMKPDLIGNFNLGVLHGGVISAALDVVGAVAIQSQYLPQKEWVGMGTVDMRIDFLLPAEGEVFTCTGEVMRPGKRLSSTRMELYNEAGSLLAMGTAIYRLAKLNKPETINV